MSDCPPLGEEDNRREEPNKASPDTGSGKDTNTINELSRWKSWFPSINSALLQSSFERWSRLSAKSNALHSIIDKHSINFAKARKELSQAARKLKYDAPYRVVVLGESGAGKSTLINALLSRNILAVGTGGAVTGVPVYIYLAPEDEQESAVIIYRTEAQTLELVQRFARRYGFKSPSSMNDLVEAISNRTFYKVVEAAGLDKETRRQVEEDINDIANVWRNLKEEGATGKAYKYNLSTQKKALQDITEETSKNNALGAPTRRIPAILRVEYRLKGLSGSGIEQTALCNTVLVDTPGIGARTLRHGELLQIEAETADAVVFVVNATRPEDKTVTMGGLIQDTLFSGFSPEERRKLADKMFLVVNQIDKIRTDDDRRRLGTSLSRLYQLLPSVFVQQGSKNAEQEYIGLNAELGLLSRKFKQGVTPGVIEEKAYLGYLANHSIQAPPLTDEVHNQALKKSGLLNLEQRLEWFLSEQRLEVMLEEADIRLKNAVDRIREVCSGIYRRHGLTTHGVTDFSVVGEFHIRKLCTIELENDRREMLAAFRSLSKKIYEWRGSDKHQQMLTKRVEEVYRCLHTVMQNSLKELLKFEKDLLGRAIDDITGIEYTEGRLRALLLETENDLRIELERAAQFISSYYNDTFSQYVGSERLHNILQGKSHNQEYITQFVDPLGQLERQQQLIRTEFSQICCWSLIYEFVQLPLFDRARKQSLGYKVWDVVRAFGPALLDGGIEATATVAGAPPGTASFFQSLIGRGKGSAKFKDPVVSTPHAEVDIASQERQFLDTLENHILAENIDEFKKLSFEQSFVRYSTAIKISLPFLEDLFFYQLGKYRRVYEQVVEQMTAEHLAHLSVSSIGSIREILMQNKSADLNEISQVNSVLSALNDVAKNEVAR